MAVSTLLSLTKLIADHELPGSHPLTGFKSSTFGVSCIRYLEREQEKVLLSADSGRRDRAMLIELLPAHAPKAPTFPEAPHA
jgi:hypothetical protein